MDIAQAILGWLQPVWTLMQMLGVLIGFIMTGSSLLAIVRAQVERSKSNIAWVGVIVGILLGNLPAALNTLSYTIFNRGTQSAIAYAGGGGGQYAQLEAAVLGVISLVGLYGVIKGFLLLRAAHESRDHFWHGIKHLIGGTLAVNIVPMLQIGGASLGSTMQSVVTKIIG
ncbi:MAG: hypothetical protein HKL99_14145 [Burkholderiales bacterium]|nr:hypothetical protein [Burkholderiales bacterium]